MRLFCTDDGFESLVGDEAVDEQILSLDVVCELFAVVVIIGRF